MATDIQLSRSEAQAIAVIAAGLAHPRQTKRRVNADDVVDVIRTLGAVQLDAVSVVARSHQTVFWSRLGTYDPALIPTLYAPDGPVTEYMAHACSMIDVDLLPLFVPMMERYRTKHAAWFANKRQGDVARRVLATITSEGPRSSREFASTPADPPVSDGWFSDKLEKRALDLLWLQGDLLPCGRDASFNRSFDLAEHVAPSVSPRRSPDDVSAIFTKRALEQLGIGAAPSVKGQWRSFDTWYVSARDTTANLKRMVADGEARSVTVEGLTVPFFMDPSHEETLEQLRSGDGWPTQTTILSPMDNLLWSNQRTEQLWGFAQKNEMYAKAADRVYGYYSMPILHRGKLIGRLDPAYDRSAKHLMIRALHLEEGVDLTDELIDSVTDAIESYLAFLGGAPGDWDVLTSTPQSFAEALYGRR